MTIDARTIAELEKSGFTDVDARCAGCGRIVQMPFRMLLERTQVTTAKTIAELHRRCRYQSCGGSQAISFAPSGMVAAWVDARAVAEQGQAHQA
jgi:hypothetical protein